jgi:hypothetical protein
MLADLPPRSGKMPDMRDVISGRPMQAAKMFNIAGDHDPRIAESI